MRAAKENRVYTISESEKQNFLDRGYDVIHDDGKVEKPPAAAVSVEDYCKLEAENARLKAENKKLKASG